MGTRDYLANRTPVPTGTLTQLFFESVDRFKGKTAYRAILPSGFHEVSFEEMLERVRRVTAGLDALGIEEGDRIALLSENRLEWSQTDWGALCAGIPLVPIHTTLTVPQIGYILRDSGVKAVFVSDDEQLEKALQATEGFSDPPKLVVFDRGDLNPPGLVTWKEFLEDGEGLLEEQSEDDFRQRALSREPEDPANVIYTSGTTGDPKGVILTQNNLWSNAKAIRMAVHVEESDETLSFLPLSHVFQRMVDLCFFGSGATITYARSLKTVAEDLRICRPTKVAGAPRVFEKMYQAVMDHPGIKGMLVRWAREVGEAWSEEILSGRRPTLVLRGVYRLAHRLVFRKIHEAVGGRIIFFFSGSAPLAPHIIKFFHSAGIKILEGYGLTETSPALSMTSMEEFSIGTVGPLIPGTELRIRDDGEILVKGPQIMKGYFNRPEETEKAFDEEGWFKTGDIGEITEEGYLRITDRKKNILVTAGGKNIAPAPIENIIKENRYVDQVVMIGDGRNFPSLLVVPAFEPLEGWAESKGVQFKCRQSLLEDHSVQSLMGTEVLSLLGDLASYERPKKLGLIKEEFTIEGGILTPNQKVKRRVVRERYGSLIERFYDPANREVDVFVEDGR